jgi:hypothetical protein
MDSGAIACILISTGKTAFGSIVPAIGLKYKIEASTGAEKNHRLTTLNKRYWQILDLTIKA